MRDIFFIVLALTIGFITGLIIGSLSIKTNILSDRKDLCEQKGGKYNYVWLSGSDKYLEVCESEKKEIKL